ncbi:MAG: ABC transporter permease [Nitrospirota bacterium]|nr:MAG: ABC transporter permease [Nitrospirota bacterium]
MIRLSNISKTYRSGRHSVHALKNVSIDIKAGEFVAIMGQSGSGKSTLLHTMGFLDRPDTGSYTFFGKETTELEDDELAQLRNTVVGFVFQQFHLLSRASAADNAALPLTYAGRISEKDRAIKRLNSVGLSERITHRPSELSGGEQQRVAIARALVNDPVVIFADEPTGNLDSKSQEEIMHILSDLNEEGNTIIMVTHEHEVADYAKRIIKMRDGEVVSDEFTGDKSEEVAVSSDAIEECLEGRRMTVGRIRMYDYIKQALNAITAHKMRSFLSMLGILIGVGAVIAMLALGQGAKDALEKRLKSLGSNLLSVRGGSVRVRGVATEAGSVTRFTFADVEAVRDIPLVKSVSALVRGSGQLVYKDNNWNTRIEGVGYDYGEMRAAVPEIGRWFTREEIQKKDKVVILGITVAGKLFGQQNPIGETIKINRLNFNVIGLLPEKGQSAWSDRDDVIVIPVTTAMYRVLGKNYLDGFYAEAVDEYSVEGAQNAIERLITKRHRIPANDKDSFYIRNMSEIQETLQATTQTMNTLLGAIAAISLIVGGIGIMNIMLVSVTERTREIGLRKALGARSRDIMIQFLIEAVTMTFSGGLIGIAIGVGSALVMTLFVGWSTKVTAVSIVLATFFSVMVGIGFGLWPAHKASRLNPVEALRYE